MNNDDDGILNDDRFEFEYNLMNTIRVCVITMCFGVGFWGHFQRHEAIGLNQKTIRILENVIFLLKKQKTSIFFLIVFCICKMKKKLSTIFQPNLKSLSVEIVLS